MAAYIRNREPPENALAGLDLNEAHQYRLLNEYIAFYDDLPFPNRKTPGHRYYYDNEWFSYSDAIFLYCFLRKYVPRRIVEVGSGFSSAVMLDSIDSLSTRRPEITFIDPNPRRLLRLMNDDDRRHVTLIGKRVQDVPLEVLLSLEENDLLFIDSSHVVKCGSDLQLLLLEVLPRLRPGVHVHFHDVFYPFDYPAAWLRAGWYWNENYFLRAFLSHNSTWSIGFFNSYVDFMFRDLIRQKMPLCAKNPGGSLYIRREVAS